METNIITSEIIGAAYNVHNALGAGFLEKVYHNAMLVELQSIGFKICSQYPINVFYKGVQVGEYYADLLIEDKVIVEFKAVEYIHPAHEIQLVNYLQATKIDIGLLINFGSSVEIKRKYRKFSKT